MIDLLSTRTHPKIFPHDFRAGVPASPADGPEAGPLPPAGDARPGSRDMRAGEDGRVPQGQDPQQIHRSNFGTSSKENVKSPVSFDTAGCPPAGEAGGFNIKKEKVNKLR